MDRILLKLGPITIYWYSFLILSAIIIGLIIAKKESLKQKIDFTFLIDLVCYTIPIAIIGARSYYVLFNFNVFKNNLLSIFYIWEGGLAIYGAIIASVIFIYFYCKKKNKNILTILDICVPSLILGQAIGRWGNFFNSEAYGRITSLSHLKELHLPNFIIKGMYIYNDGVYNYYEPTFLYESIWCLIGFVILIIIRNIYKKRQKGLMFSIYAIWYGIGRLIIEGYRMDSLYLGSIRISQLVSIIFILIGIILIIKERKKCKNMM